MTIAITFSIIAFIVFSGYDNIASCDNGSSTTKHPGKRARKNLGVTHLAYNILSSNVVTKFGAYCTLYCHKKSGAVLFSVRTMMTTNALAWGSKLKGVGPSGSKGLFRSPTRGVTNGSKGWDVGPTGSKGSFSGLSGSGPNGSKGLGVVPSCSQDLLLREANASRYLSLQEAKAVREARLLLDTLFEGLDA